MKLARVTAPVVATIHHPTLTGHRLLLCNLLDHHTTPTPTETIALDLVGAAPDQTVLILDEGSSARHLLNLDHGPIRAVIIGIVDQVTGPVPT